MEVKKIVEEQEIWNENEKVTKSEEEAMKLIPQSFYKWIYIFWKKASKRIREERGEVYKFIKEQLRKRFIRSSKSS